MVDDIGGNQAAAPRGLGRRIQPGTPALPTAPTAPAAPADPPAQDLFINATSSPPKPAARVANYGFCVVHPEVAAARHCGRCRAPMCATCDFAFPDGTHACPACVANPSTPVSSNRTALAVLGLVMACLATVVLGSIMTGLWVLSEAAAGGVFTVLVFLPVLAGLVCSCSAMSKRLGNNALLMTSMIWNLVMTAIVGVLVVIGNLS